MLLRHNKLLNSRRRNCYDKDDDKKQNRLNDKAEQVLIRKKEIKEDKKEQFKGAEGRKN